MTSLNFSKGCAPDSMRPLMKNAGVPLTPTLAPSAMSLSMTALNSCFARHSSNYFWSMPTSPAIAFSFSVLRSEAAQSFW